MGRTPLCSWDGLRKGAWTAEEDHKLISYIQKQGEGGWRFLPQKAGLQRCGKSCRLRWANYLRPGIKRGDFTPEEDQTIIKLQGKLGNRWAEIARHLPKRTDNEIKNYWNAHLKKRLANMGVDPAKIGDDTECAKPQQSEQPTAQHSASAVLLNKLATRFTQCVAPLRATQTLQPMSFNSNGGAENSDIFCHPLSSGTVPETSAYLADNNSISMTSSLTVPESEHAINEGDEQSAGVLNDIIASEFATLSCVDELNDWQNNNNSDIGYSDSAMVYCGRLWDDNVTVDDDDHIIFDVVGSLGFYNSKLYRLSDDSS